jgi:dTDP-4-amino-4,6-dideoxygalactose transaminase
MFDVDEERLVTEVLRSGWVAQGPQVAAFERAVAMYTGAGFAVAVNSGTAALHAALLAAGIGPGDTVLVPAFTWVATANVVEMVAATTAFVDIDPRTFTVSSAALETALARVQTNGNTAFMPVSLFGRPIDYAPLKGLIEKYALIVIEDAACALGAFCGGRHAGREALAACLSFHPRKIITTGEGGMVITDSPSIAASVTSLRNHGTAPTVGTVPAPSALTDHDRVGYNYRLTDLQGAIGVAQMKKIDWILGERREAAERYHKLLSFQDRIVPPSVTAGGEHAWQAYVVWYRGREVVSDNDVDLTALPGLHRERNALMARLDRDGIMTRPGTQAVSALKYFRLKYSLAPADYPVAMAAEQLTIALPLYPGITMEDQERVVEALLAHDWSPV